MVKVKLAGIPVCFENRYLDLEILCRGYETKDPPVITLATTQEAIEQERIDQIYEFTDGYLETICLYRKLALEMLKHNIFLMHASVIEVDGEVYASYDMDEVKGIIPISTPDGGENRVWVQEDLVFMESANCPDQTCVKQGVIRDGTVPIVCLPHKVIVRIEGGDSGLDAAN